MSAILRYENGLIPYTPSGADVASGEVVATGAFVGVAPAEILDGQTGSINVDGAVYEITCDHDTVAPVLGQYAVIASSVVTGKTQDPTVYHHGVFCEGTTAGKTTVLVKLQAGGTIA